MERVHVFIYGLVQGVGYRNYIYNKARLLNIKGWIKNLDDDKVEAVFEGDKEDISKILDYCIKGHFSAKVKDIKINKENIKNEKEFRILWG